MTPEARLTGRIVQYLQQEGCFVTKTHGTQFGRSGMPDLCVLVPVAGMPYAIPVFLEVKMPGRQPTRRQQAMLDWIMVAGGVARVVWSLEDVRWLLVVLRAKAGEWSAHQSEKG